nr:prepilin-type N-terminal cleavage/methylation domain-containing protein [Deltaproteobacteria bacterium]
MGGFFQDISSFNRLTNTQTYLVKRNQVLSCCGFTILEILLVMSIIATLSSIAFFFGAKYIDRVQNARAVQDIRILEREITVYLMEKGTYPLNLADIGYADLRDPWGKPYVYIKIADSNTPRGKLRRDRFWVPINSDYDLYSMGKDGKSKLPLQNPQAKDDIIRANDGQYVGLAEYF